MPQTIQLDLAVDPTQVQSAITRVHQGVATGAQVGSMHASGAMQGLGQMFGIGGGAGGARQVPMQMAPMNAVNVRQNNAVLPFQQASHNFSEVMARATAVSSQISQQAMAQHADVLLPPPGNFRRVEAMKSAVGVAESLATFSIGSKLGGFIVPGPVGAIGGGLLASLAVPMIKKVTGVDVTQNRFIEQMLNNGKNLNRPGSKEYAQEVQMNRDALELGTTFMAYGGVMPGRPGYKASATSSMGIFKNVLGRMKDSTGSEIKGYMTYLAATGNKQFRALNEKFNESKLTYKDNVAKDLTGMLSNVKQQAIMRKLTPEQMAQEYHAIKYAFTAGTGAKGPSRWEQMGKSFGYQMGLGKKWGKDAIYAMKGRALTDLGLTSEDKKMLGGSHAVAGMMAGSMGQSYSAGGLGYTQLAAWKGGAGADVGILDIGGYAANATSTVGGYVDFIAGRKDQMKSMGGKALYNQHRSHYMQMIKMARENYPDLRGKSNKDVLTALLISSEGLPDLKAHAKAAMILGIGEKFSGGGSGLYRLSAVHTSNAVAPAMARILSDKLGRTVTDDEFKMLGNQQIWSANTSKAITSFTGKGWKTSTARKTQIGFIAKQAWQKMQSKYGDKMQGWTDADKMSTFKAFFAKAGAGKIAGLNSSMLRKVGGAVMSQELSQGGNMFEGGFQQRILSHSMSQNITTAVLEGAASDPATLARARASMAIFKATNGKSYNTSKQIMRRILKFQKKYKTEKSFAAIQREASIRGDDGILSDVGVLVSGGYEWGKGDMKILQQDAMKANASSKKITGNDMSDDLNDTQQLVQGVAGIMKNVQRMLDRKKKQIAGSKR